MREPDVTVVVPVYNTMPYLTATLDSLVRQSMSHDRFEVVAVDDGSTDGSGAELDRYAAQHPALFTVVHQDNSGGPAGPCNVGLSRAHGRYVFFLGADDYLGDEALERMVARADAWESDVVCARIVGEGGRWVNQVLYAEDASDVPFPSAALASALSNTKLFRRSLLTRHDISFARDLKVGSDQPFTIEAMLHARRISVLGDYAYYHAVKRDDASNITYSSDWRSRFAGISAVVEHVADLVGPGEGRDHLLGRHFSGEIATLLRRDLAEVAEEEQAELVDAVNTLTTAYLTDTMLPLLRVLDRWRFLLARDLRLPEIRALTGLDEGPAPLQVDGDEVVLHYPGLPPSTAAASDRIGRHLAAAVEPAEVVIDGSVLDVTVPVVLVPPSRPVARLVLARASEGESPPPRSYRRDPGAGLVSATAELVDGRLHARLDLDDVPDEPGGTGDTGLLALRVQFDIGERTYGVPVPFERSQHAPSRHDDRPATARGDARSMTVVELVRPRRSPLEKLRSRWGRNK
jgi:poly(ribitol-phosphate) beta-N-acetylglucosaminyltransferase